MKTRQILFNGPMVRALLDDSKTQTRRAFKTTNGGVWPNRNDLPGMRQILRSCPYGHPGDRLWVRETFFAFGCWETRFSTKKGRDEWHFVDMTAELGKSYVYAADGFPEGYAKHHDGGRGGVTPTWWKRPAIFMPNWASRITLEIIGVRVEQLHGISSEDALQEGVERHDKHDLLWMGPSKDDLVPHYVAEYRKIWESINGPGSWDANPWVWVIEFKRITP